MRPAERLFGPFGVQMVEFVDGQAKVWCRNGYSRVDNCFTIDNATGTKIAMWIAEGKPGNIQDAFPELSVDQREQMISGMTPEDWKETFSE